MVFVSKLILPTPIDKVVVIFQALMLALGFLTLGGLGATYVSVVGGLLTALWRTSFAPFTLIFSVMFGFMVDGFSHAFSVKSSDGNVKTNRMVASVTISTALTGMISYYITVHLLILLPRNLILEMIILAGGIINGIAGGYLSILIWRKNLKPFIMG